MKVSEIPSNELVIMTPELYQEFCQGGCVPACHLTDEWISLGDKFKLATVPVAHHPSGATAGLQRLETKEVMLAEKSSVDVFIRIQESKVKQWEENKQQVIKEGRGGCFRVNGKIVP